jgi:hypothetical protein
LPLTRRDKSCGQWLHSERGCCAKARWQRGGN